MKAWPLLQLGARAARGKTLRWLFLSATVALGALALVSVSALTEAVEQGIRLRSRELLGGDLAVESRRPLPELTPFLPARHRSAPRVSLSILSSMVRTTSGKSRLAELKAIDDAHGAYPLAGKLETAPRAPLGTLLDDHSVLLAPELQRELGLTRGDTLLVGGQSFVIAGEVLREPDPLAFSFTLGPRVLLTRGGLERTDLLDFGNRIRHRTLLALAPGTSTYELTRVKAALLASVPGAGTYVTVETHMEAQPALRATLDRVQRYLGLVALLSLLVASIGVAQSVSAWLAQAVPETAILRVLGLRSREVFWLYFAQLSVFACLGSVLGSLLGAALPTFLLRPGSPLLPPELGGFFPWRSFARGVALGTLVPLAASLPSLLAVWRAPPARVLRSEAAPLPAPRGLELVLVALAGATLYGAAWLESKSWLSALVFTLVVATLAVVCLLAARALTSALGRLPRARLPALVWHGATALRRPVAGTTGSLVALGLGTLVVLTVVLIESQLQRSIASALPERAPSVFLLDIQPDQWPQIEALGRALGATRLDSVPVVMARLLAVDGVSVTELARARGTDPNTRAADQRALTREQRIAWMQKLPDDNRILEGALWSDPQAAEVSLEVGFARELGARLGSVLRFDVQGVPIELTVSSLRSVEWRSFATNFFLVAEPGVLDDAPHFRLGALRLPSAQEQTLQDRLAVALPNVTMLRVRLLLERAREVFDSAALAVRLLGGVAVLTGLVVLTGGVAASQHRRAREAALWKTLGLTRARVVALFAVEYALTGAVAGALGALGAYGLSLLVARQLLSLQTFPSWSACLLSVLVTSVLSVVGGLLASLRALLVKPIAVLRGGST